MGKKVAILILALFAGTGFVAGSFGPEKTSQALLNDGFVLTGVDGRMSSSDGNDVWSFLFISDVNDGKARVGANTSLQLLPSSTLEKMTADMKERLGEDYRIWARVTKYKGRNFLFPIYFLPLSKVKDSALATPADANSADISQAAQIMPKPTANDPNGTLAIPKAIIDRLSDRPTVYRRQPEEPNSQDQNHQSIKQDYVLADRTGFISAGLPSPIRLTHGGLTMPRTEFVLDGLGLSVQQATFRLLPCQVLEQAELESAEGGLRADQIRLKIAGIITEYKGDKYLLLQRATRVYSHGNFGR
ncbi:MAG: hypothetical protein MUO33_09985 [Sedimentisphaerales bacterium]|nr:hypothetical protein [Sedimentisphaerales bacterium]